MMSRRSYSTKAFLKSFFITPSIAVKIEPTASLVASLLPGDTIVSPSKKFKPCLGKDSLHYLDNFYHEHILNI